MTTAAMAADEGTLKGTLPPYTAAPRAVQGTSAVTPTAVFPTSVNVGYTYVLRVTGPTGTYAFGTGDQLRLQNTATGAVLDATGEYLYSATELRGNVYIPSGTATGYWSVQVQDVSAGTTWWYNPDVRVYLNPEPTVSSVAPSSGSVGTSVPVTITGTNFQYTSYSIAMQGGVGGTTTIYATASSPTLMTQMTSTIAIPATAYTGPYTLYLRPPNAAYYKTVRSSAFTVNGPILSTPVLTGPANGVTLYNYPRTTTLTWNPVSGATSYKVERWYLSGSTYTKYADVTVTGNTNCYYTFDFIGDQKGRWRVTAMGPGRNPSVSVYWYFTYYTGAPTLQTPSLISPASGAVFGHYPRQTTLSWKPVAGATGYRVEREYQDPTTGTWYPYAGVTTTGMLTTSYTFQFVGAQPGRWRITAYGTPTYKDSVTSAWRTFSFTR